MIRSVIVDDEPKNLKILAKMLEEFCEGVEVVGKADKHALAIEIINREKPDLVFLDIAMPDGNAFDLLDKLQPIDFEIIFVTAFDTYSLTAFKYSAVDYLLKPVNIEELESAVARAIERKKVKQNSVMQLETLLNTLQKQQPNAINKVALPSKNGLIFLPVNEIVRCEASGAYTNFYLANKTKLVSSRRISDYEELLPASLFFRIHHSHIINLNFVIQYHRGRGGSVEMSDGTMLELASRRKEEFLSRFGIKG
jgi:two-component system LytT family response regulator